MMNLDYPQPSRFADQIRELPDRVEYRREELCTPEFMLAEDGPLQMYYAPLDFINSQARVAIVGITPGWTQMAGANSHRARHFAEKERTLRATLKQVLGASPS